MPGARCAKMITNETLTRNVRERPLPRRQNVEMNGVRHAVRTPFDKLRSADHTRVSVSEQARPPLLVWEWHRNNVAT